MFPPYPDPCNGEDILAIESEYNTDELCKFGITEVGIPNGCSLPDRGMVKFVTKGLEAFPIGGGVPTGICCALMDGLGAFCDIETAGIDPVNEGTTSDTGTDPTFPPVEGIGLDTGMASFGLGLFGLFG
jgi:hypothetical protein